MSFSELKQCFHLFLSTVSFRTLFDFTNPTYPSERMNQRWPFIFLLHVRFSHFAVLYSRWRPSMLIWICDLWAYVNRSFRLFMNLRTSLGLESLISEGVRNAFPKVLCLRRRAALHSHRMCSAVSAASLHKRQIWSSALPILYRWYLRVVWPVKRPVMVLSSILLIDKAIIAFFCETVMICFSCRCPGVFSQYEDFICSSHNLTSCFMWFFCIL